MYIFNLSKFTKSGIEENSESRTYLLTNGQLNRNLVIDTDYNNIVYVADNKTNKI